MAGNQKHPYHLVDPSPWPITGSLAAFVLAIGAAVYLHPTSFGLKESAWWFFLPGLLLVLYTMFMWWRDVVKEAQVDHAHTKVVQLGLRYGMILFIASEVMFFAAFFWAFFDNFLYATEAKQIYRVHANGDTWPPSYISVFDAWDLPFMNTLILLLSGVTVTWAHHALKEGNRRDLLRGLAATVVLGLCFTTLQAVEYLSAPFSFQRGFNEGCDWANVVETCKLVKGGSYPSAFFMATGFHGFHVIVGTIFLAVCFFRARAGHFKPEQHFGFEAAAWYWHFVDVVWLFLFFCIYVFGSAGAPIAVH
ncbi:MAG: cytochrome c oxidase subunit 3 [Rhodospirillaceae bacterium]|nr:cytochrome c oxidase subunit 3 [Rhodospirillaceae bacterium]